jgi:starch synthase
MVNKQLNKRLQNKLGLKVEAETPLLGVVSRLTYQKGLDMLLSCAEALIKEHNCQLVLLGSGDTNFEQGYRELAKRFPNQISVTIGYNEELFASNHGRL